MFVTRTDRDNKVWGGGIIYQSKSGIQKDRDDITVKQTVRSAVRGQADIMHLISK